MQGIKLNRLPSRQGYPETHATVLFLGACYWLGFRSECPLWFHTWLILMSVMFPSPSQSFYPALSSGTKNNASAKGWLSHLRLSPAARPRCPVPPVVEHLTFEGQTPHPIQWVREHGWRFLSANQGFGVFWFISSLLAEPIFSQPPL